MVNNEQKRSTKLRKPSMSEIEKEIPFSGFTMVDGKKTATPPEASIVRNNISNHHLGVILNCL